MKTVLQFPQRLEDRKVQKLIERIEDQQTRAQRTREAVPAPKPPRIVAS